jgi:hypothetical protein
MREDGRARVSKLRLSINPSAPMLSALPPPRTSVKKATDAFPRGNASSIQTVTRFAPKRALIRRKGADLRHGIDTR